MNEIQQLKKLQRIRKLAKFLDTAIGIPGTKFRIGLDPILENHLQKSSTTIQEPKLESQVVLKK